MLSLMYLYAISFACHISMLFSFASKTKTEAREMFKIRRAAKACLTVNDLIRILFPARLCLSEATFVQSAHALSSSSSWY